MNSTNYLGDIRSKIFSMEQGEVFGIKDLIEFGTYDSIRKSLSRLCTDQIIKRVVTGIYCFTLRDPDYVPAAYEVARALARNNNNWSITWGTEHARHILGISASSPKHFTFLSTGPKAQYEYSGVKIHFQPVRASFMHSMHPKSALVTSALMDLRTHKITPFEIQQLSQILTVEEKHDLFEDRIYAPARLRCVFEIICGEYGLIGR